MTTGGELRRVLVGAHNNASLMLVLRPDVLTSLADAVAHDLTVGMSLAVQEATGNAVRHA